MLCSDPPEYAPAEIFLNSVICVNASHTAVPASGSHQ
ncbi:hypothetical protein [Janthinobacterium sp. P210006]